MKKEKQLAFARGIFAFIVFVILGVIVVTEKFGNLKIPKIEKEIENYRKENNLIDEDLQEEEIIFKNATYSMKITSKQNKNLYFYITYSNHKIKDTYKKDYLEGKTLLTKIQKDMEKEINQKTNTTCKVHIISTLNNYTTKVQEQIIKEEKLIELNFYTLEKEVLVNEWKKEDITKKIIETINKYETKKINPKNYTLIITNKNKASESIKIMNLTTEFQNNDAKEEIISDIINDENTKLLKQNKITYEILS